ncbi:MAG: hypothetical protein KDD70_00220 [Bdellovibrionales bacterium]|nr:hypothetical protein [Bdellovibrionales bacterium]
MITDEELELLRANPRFLARALRERGIEVNILDIENEIIEAEFAGHRELLLDIDSSLMPFASSSIASSKSVTKLLLRRGGVSVPKGQRFLSDEVQEACAFADLLGYPVVAKPSLGVQGELVHLDLSCALDLEWALRNIQEKRGVGEVLIEEQFFGKEYRVFYTQRGDYAVLHRDPAHVIGNGLNTIRELAEVESYRRMNPRINCLCPIELDEEASRYLRIHGMTLDTVPAEDAKVYLRSSSNIKMGGVATDVTDDVHPSVLDIARRALAAVPGLPYAGIDFMTEDISAEQSERSYRVLEINSLPGIGMHINPAHGSSRDVAGMLVDLIFPETCGNSRVSREGIRRAA